MPDILIRMEMPETCDECPMYTCMHNHADCPLIELPEHGDLIDADAFCRNIFNGTGDPFIKAGVMAHVKVAPTIVPSNKEGSECF